MRVVMAKLGGARTGRRADKDEAEIMLKLVGQAVHGLVWCGGLAKSSVSTEHDDAGIGGAVRGARHHTLPAIVSDSAHSRAASAGSSASARGFAMLQSEKYWPETPSSEGFAAT